MITPEGQREFERRMSRSSLVKRIEVVLQKLGGTLSTDREEKLYEMRVSELEKLSVLLMGVSTFRNAVKMVVGSIADSDRTQLTSN